MKKSFILSFLLLLSSLASAQKVEDIIKKYHAAIGGAKWDKVTGLKYTASIDGGGGMKIPIEVVQLRDGKKYTKISIQGQEIYQDVFDGNVSWSTNFMTKAAEKSESDMTENTKRAAKDFPDALINASKAGYKASLEGSEKIDGVDCYKVKLVKKTLLDKGVELPNIEFYYIDKENNVPIMMETEIPVGEMKGKMSQIKYSDYQEVGGVFIAHSQSMGVKDGQSQTITFDKIELSPTVDANVFKFVEKAPEEKK